MILLLLACQLAAFDDSTPPDSEVDADADTDADADSDSDADSDADSDSDADADPTDWARFQALLDGEAGAEETLLSISSSEGWPMEHDGQYVFAALADGGTIQLAGDHNGWTPTAMTSQSGVWWTQVAVNDPKGSRYKFVHDGDYRADPWARAYTYDENGEISYVRGPRGHLERWLQVGDGGIAPRTVRVWVPEQAVTHQLYVHDGQNLFDPDAVWGGWHLQDSLSDSTMAVGIDNSGAGRVDEYCAWEDAINGQVAGGEGSDYAAYVLGTVRPLVESRYGKAGTVGTMGSSLGGLVALTIVLEQPDDWDWAGSLSGTVGWGSMELDNDTVMQRYVAEGWFGVPVYLDSGGHGGSGCVDSDGDGIQDDSPDAADNYCENRQMADALAASGWTWDSTLWHWHEANAPHNEAAWAARVYRPVQVFEGL